MTILEVLIAAVLLTFVVLGALGAISRGMILANHARMITLASQVLQSAVEDLRLKNYSNLKAYAAQSQPRDFTSFITSERLNSTFTSTMALTANFTTVYSSTPTRNGKISVLFTLTWRESNGNFNRTALTYFSEMGLSDYIYVGF